MKRESEPLILAAARSLEDYFDRTGHEETVSEQMLRLAIELRQLGVSDSQTRRILATHDLEVVERQLRWLPYRSARKKASMILAAIDNDYDAPANLPSDE